MARAQSAGVILFRRRGDDVEVFLVHPGGPFFARRDDGAWSIPKGEFTDEAPEVAACREFAEETGVELTVPLIALPVVVQSRAKTVHPFAAEGDLDAANVRSNTFTLEWPPRSGRNATFPEVDRAGWFSLEQARVKVLKGQQPILDALVQWLASSDTTNPAAG